MNMVLPTLGFLIVALAIILLFRDSMGGLGIIVSVVVALGILSFFGWFIIDLSH